MSRLSGTLAASVTPLEDGGARPDEDAVGPVVDFLHQGGVDGILALGTTGEGIMLSGEERRRVAERFVEASAGRLRVAVHCGAQTTSETAALAAHAAEAGADAVAVISPPYYPFEPVGLLRHFREAAAAAAPLPFYVYEFADRSGYAVPVEVLSDLRGVADNFLGMKVSDAPLERFAPYLLEGLDVLVGPEALILEGLGRGAIGAVSGLASAFPELVAELVRSRDPALGERVGALRARLQRLPVPAVFKAALRLRGVPVREDVRPPLRTLTDEERAEVAAAVEGAATPAG
ncbi:MAG TPA: dihydrodipicolinate synthase family protein [Actinomycetota bacterium]